jgi:hypothetical protein
MNESGAMITISKLTQTLPCERVLTADVAKRLPFFEDSPEYHAYCSDDGEDAEDLRILKRIAASLDWTWISGRLEHELAKCAPEKSEKPGWKWADLNCQRITHVT